MYRNRKAAEVRIETPADVYKASMTEKIAGMRRELASIRSAGDGKQSAAIRVQIDAARVEMKTSFARMKAEGKAEQARIRAEEKAADHEFAEMIRRRELSPMEKTERLP